MEDIPTESGDPRSIMQSIFNTTRCYDVMQESNKVKYITL